MAQARDPRPRPLLTKGPCSRCLRCPPMRSHSLPAFDDVILDPRLPALWHPFNSPRLHNKFIYITGQPVIPNALDISLTFLVLSHVLAVTYSSAALGLCASRLSSAYAVVRKGRRLLRLTRQVVPSTRDLCMYSRHPRSQLTVSNNRLPFCITLSTPTEKVPIARRP